MKTWICTTLASLFGPMQGAARLYAYLKKAGHDISLKDLNQDTYFTLLSRDFLEPTLNRAQYLLEPLTRSKFLRADIGSILLHSSNNAIRGLLSGNTQASTGSRITAENVFYALLSEPEAVISAIDRSRQALDKDFLSLDPAEFLRHYQTLLCGKAIIDATYFPAQLDFGFGLHGTAYSASAGDTIRAINDERHNFLIPYYHHSVIPLLNRENPGVVGLSLTHTGDFIPAFTLAHLIKKEHPEIHICLGGATLTEIAYRLAKNPPLWELFDSLVLGPGEYAFSQLIEHLEAKKDLATVPNLMYRENGSIKKSEAVHEFDINDACTPEYVSVRPGSALALETSSGCYWGKCIFCYYPRQGTASPDDEYNKKRVRRIELVLEDIRKLREAYDPSYIGITDSSLHPRRIEQIAEMNLNSDKKVSFSAFIRLEKEFKSTAFCQKLADGGFLGGQAGLESGSQRINDIINKGVSLDDARTIIRNLDKAGILIHLYAIIGAPGETTADALMTYDFIKRWHRRLALGWQIYPLYVLEQSALLARAAEFGIQATALPDEFLSQGMAYSVASGLSQADSLILSISYQEKLAHLMHPLHQLMDPESHKVLLLAYKARGFTPEDIKKIYRGR